MRIDSMCNLVFMLDHCFVKGNRKHMYCQGLTQCAEVQFKLWSLSTNCVRMCVTWGQ